MITITRHAIDKKTGLTIGELRQLLAEADHAGLEPNVAIKVTIGFRSQIQTIEVTG